MQMMIPANVRHSIVCMFGSSSVVLVLNFPSGLRVLTISSIMHRMVVCCLNLDSQNSITE